MFDKLLSRNLQTLVSTRMYVLVAFYCNLQIDEIKIDTKRSDSKLRLDRFVGKRLDYRTNSFLMYPHRRVVCILYNHVAHCVSTLR